MKSIFDRVWRVGNFHAISVSFYRVVTEFFCWLSLGRWTGLQQLGPRFGDEQRRLGGFAPAAVQLLRLGVGLDLDVVDVVLLLHRLVVVVFHVVVGTRIGRRQLVGQPHPLALRRPRPAAGQSAQSEVSHRVHRPRRASSTAHWLPPTSFLAAARLLVTSFGPLRRSRFHWFTLTSFLAAAWLWVTSFCRLRTVAFPLAAGDVTSQSSQ